MTDNHLLIFPEDSPRSVGYYAIKPPKNLVVFIHGFAGHATQTWGDFIHLVRNLPEFDQSDVIFYGYKSLKQHMDMSALEFYHRLDVWSSPLVVEGVDRGKNIYERIVIVAHSLGGLVTRSALLYAQNAHKTWIARTRMVLFAPAHKGARVIELAMKCLPAKFSGFGLVAHLFIPVLGDLKEGSEPIKDVMNRTEQLLAAGKGNFTKAAVTVHAIKDRTILGGLYCSDPTPEEDLVHDHITVCKPYLSIFEKPFIYLVKYMN